MQVEDRPELYTDYQEISPWDTAYIKRFKSVKKPWYKYFMGTMGDLHLLCQGSPVLLFIFGFFRSFGMFIGISNPILGFGVLVSVAMDNWYILGFYTVAVLSGMFWCFYLKINSEMIYNGLYPCQAIMISVYMTLVHDKVPRLWTLLPVLFIMALIEIVTFQTLCEILVVRLKCGPSTIAGILWSLIFMISTRGSYHFNTNLHSSGFVSVWDPEKINITMGLTVKRYAWETLRGAAFYSATTNVWGAIPLYIGVAFASPVLCVGMWVGSFLGVGSAWILGIEPDEMFNGAYGVNGAIIFANLSSVYFVLNIHSVIMATFSTFGTTMACIAMNYFMAPSGIGCSVLPSILVLITVYLSRSHFPRLNPVELVCITTPEDHLSRFWLSQRIVRHLDIKRHISSYKYLSGDRLQSLERGLLPILMCSYVSRDEREKLNTLLLYGANPNNTDYDGRTPLHIAAADNRVEMAGLLLKYQNSINTQDNFGNTALCEALNNNNFEMAAYIHAAGGQLYMKEEKLASRLCYFVAEGNNTALGVWLECGANPNVCDYDEQYPLHLAYSRHNTKALVLLTKYGANDNVRDKWGNTPCKSDSMGCTIIEMAARIDPCSRRPLTMQLFRNKTRASDMADPELIAAVLLALLENDDEVHVNSLIPSLLCTSANCGFDKIIREIAPRLSDPNPADYDRRTPLHLASETGYVNIAKLLVKNGADVNCKDRFGTTPLTCALMYERYEVARYLQRNGAKLLMSDEMTVDVLFSVVFNNNIEQLEALYSAGIALTASDYNGRSVFGQAKDAGSPGILKFLNSSRLADIREMDGQMGHNVSPAWSYRSSQSPSTITNV